MELLEFTEGLDDILVLSQLFSSLAELLLCFKVLLEVKVAKVAVDLDHVVELLHIELIGVVKIPELGCRNRTDLPPAVLEFPEGREC